MGGVRTACNGDFGEEDDVEKQDLEVTLGERDRSSTPKAIGGHGSNGVLKDSREGEKDSAS